MPLNSTEMERIIDTYGNDVLRSCYLYLHDRDLAEDAWQDTMITIYKKYHTLRKETSERAWILSIAINICKNYRRTTWFKKVSIVESFYNNSADKLQSISDEDQDHRLIQNIMNLKPIYREVIILYYYQQLKISDIASILNIKESNVTVRLSRARSQLKKNIERGCINE